jgi:hypothetical protein
MKLGDLAETVGFTSFHSFRNDRLLSYYESVVRRVHPEAEARQVCIHTCTHCGVWWRASTSNVLNEPPRVEIIPPSMVTGDLCFACYKLSTESPDVFTHMWKVLNFQKMLIFEEMRALEERFNARLELEEGIRRSAAEALGLGKKEP